MGMTYLITGGTGSFGQRCCQVLLSKGDTHKVIIFSRDEWKQHEMSQRITDERVRYFLGDVRDLSRLRRAFRGVDTVIHAAALKQVPALEYNPAEGVKTNINGAHNVIEAVADAGVMRVIALSTDKAVNPINLYGATKLVAEKLFLRARVYGKARYYVVRYGNVIGSRGSVLQTWLQQKQAGKPLTITDTRMTRFWLTLDDAIAFALRYDHSSDHVNVPCLMGFAVADLATVIFPGGAREVVGIRPGEKLHEMLRTQEECEQLGLNHAEYRSDTAPRMTQAEIQEALWTSGLYGR